MSQIRGKKPKRTRIEGRDYETERIKVHIKEQKNARCSGDIADLVVPLQQKHQEQ